MASSPRPSETSRALRRTSPKSDVSVKVDGSHPVVTTKPPSNRRPIADWIGVGAILAMIVASAALISNDDLTTSAAIDRNETRLAPRPADGDSEVAGADSDDADGSDRSERAVDASDRSIESETTTTRPRTSTTTTARQIPQRRPASPRTAAQEVVIIPADQAREISITTTTLPKATIKRPTTTTTSAKPAVKRNNAPASPTTAAPTTTAKPATTTTAAPTTTIKPATPKAEPTPKPVAKPTTTTAKKPVVKAKPAPVTTTKPRPTTTVRRPVPTTAAPQPKQPATTVPPTTRPPTTQPPTTTTHPPTTQPPVTVPPVTPPGNSEWFIRMPACDAMSRTFFETSRWYWGLGMKNDDGKSYYWQIRIRNANYSMPDFDSRHVTLHQRQEADGKWTIVFSGTEALRPWGSVNMQFSRGVDVRRRALQDKPEFFCVRA